MMPILSERPTTLRTSGWSRSRTSGERVHPPQTRKSCHVCVGRVEFRLVLDGQGGEVRVRRQIATPAHRLEEIEQNVRMTHFRVDKNRLRSGRPHIYKVYPRECGGTYVTLTLSRRCPVYPRECGEPAFPRSAYVARTVYPRECGGTRIVPVGRCYRYGLSPRVRGNPFAIECTYPPFGSIPASAGEPIADAKPFVGPRVYPRECGGTPAWPRPSATSSGLSPRVRGNPVRCRPLPSRERSIPASAGEPKPPRWRAS